MNSCEKSVYAYAPINECWSVSAFIPAKSDYKLNTLAFNKIYAFPSLIPICFTHPVYYFPNQITDFVNDLNNSNFNAVLSGNYIVINDTEFDFSSTIYSQYLSAFSPIASSIQIQQIQKYITPTGQFIFVNETTHDVFTKLQSNWISAACISPTNTQINAISALAKQNQNDIFNLSAITSQIYTTLSACCDLNAENIAEISTSLDSALWQDIEKMQPAVWRDHTTLNINSQSIVAVSWGDRSTNRELATVGSAPSLSASGRWNGKPYFKYTAGQYFTTSALNLKDVFVVCNPERETGLSVVLSKPATFYLAACTGSTKRPLYAGAGGQLTGDTFGYQGDFSISKPRIVTMQVTDVGGLMSWASPQQVVAYGANGHRQIYHKALNGSVVNLDYTRIGRYNGGAGDFAGGIACELGFTRCLSQTERGKVMRYLANTYGIDLPTYYNMVGLGDSIMARQGLSQSEGLMALLLGSSGSGLLDATKWSGINGAVGGNTTYDVLSNNLGTLNAFADDAINVAVIWVGTNNNGITSVSVALSDVSEIIAEVRSRNGYTILLGMLPTQAGSESFRTPYNAGLAALASANSEGTVYYFNGDLLAPNLYNVSPVSWSTYYQDGLHPNAAGIAYLAPILAAEIDNFLDGKLPLTR